MAHAYKNGMAMSRCTFNGESVASFFCAFNFMLDRVDVVPCGLRIRGV